MNLLKRIAQKLGKLTGLKDTPKPVDYSNPPPKFLPLARPAVRRKTWFRSLVKAQLKSATRNRNLPTISKMEKRLIRKNVFQGHWNLHPRRLA